MVSGAAVNYAPQQDYSQGMMANGRFMITKSIGKGSFGEIFQGVDTLSNQEVAIKMEHKHCKVKVLTQEFKILKSLQGLEGYPKLHWFGQEHSQNILVMELLGPSLSTLFKNNGSRFSLQTVLKLTDQILHRIELMHNVGYIHRDIKPSNFVMGLPGSKNQNNLYVIDFGLSKPYMDIKRKIHFPSLPPGRSLTGTARYASLNSHQGFTLSRRDDLESIAYMLIQFLRGNLPWQGAAGANKLEKYQNILEIKMLTIDEILCKELPEQFCRFLKYVKDLEYDEKPDYKRLRLEFKVLMMDTFNQNDTFVYDWQVKKIRQNSQKRPTITVAPLISAEPRKQIEEKKQQEQELIRQGSEQLKIPILDSNFIDNRIEIVSIKQSVRQNESEDEDVKIPILFHNFEGFKEIESQNQSVGLIQINQDDPLDTENDPYHIQKMVAEDYHANNIKTLQTNIPPFAFYPDNKTNNARIFLLTNKQEQARLNRLKQLYGQYKGLCPNFLFSKDKKDSNSLGSMEPLIIENDNQGQVHFLERVSKHPNY
eukprot:403375115